ncbi:MAG: hypothetical protein ACTJF0_02505 [Psychroflexus halocasei]
MEIYFPDELANSPYHTEKELNKFLVVKDEVYGDVIFLKGEYNLKKVRKDIIMTLISNQNDKKNYFNIIFFHHCKLWNFKKTSKRS